MCLRLIPTPRTPSFRWGVLKALMRVSGNPPPSRTATFPVLLMGPSMLCSHLRVKHWPLETSSTVQEFLSPSPPNPALYPHQGGDQDPGFFIWGARPWKTQFQDDSIRKHLGPPSGSLDLEVRVLGSLRGPGSGKRAGLGRAEATAHGPRAVRVQANKQGLRAREAGREKEGGQGSLEGRGPHTSQQTRVSTTKVFSKWRMALQRLAARLVMPGKEREDPVRCRCRGKEGISLSKSRVARRMPAWIQLQAAK